MGFGASQEKNPLLNYKALAKSFILVPQILKLQQFISFIFFVVLSHSIFKGPKLNQPHILKKM